MFKKVMNILAKGTQKTHKENSDTKREGRLLCFRQTQAYRTVLQFLLVLFLIAGIMPTGFFSGTTSYGDYDKDEVLENLKGIYDNIFEKNELMESESVVISDFVAKSIIDGTKFSVDFIGTNAALNNDLYYFTFTKDIEAEEGFVTNITMDDITTGGLIFEQVHDIDDDDKDVTIGPFDKGTYVGFYIENSNYGPHYSITSLNDDEECYISRLEFGRTGYTLFAFEDVKIADSDRSYNDIAFALKPLPPRPVLSEPIEFEIEIVSGRPSDVGRSTTGSFQYDKTRLNPVGHHRIPISEIDFLIELNVITHRFNDVEAGFSKTRIQRTDGYYTFDGPRADFIDGEFRRLKFEAGNISIFNRPASFVHGQAMNNMALNQAISVNYKRDDDGYLIGLGSPNTQTSFYNNNNYDEKGIPKTGAITSDQIRDDINSTGRMVSAAYYEPFDPNFVEGQYFIYLYRMHENGLPVWRNGFGKVTYPGLGEEDGGNGEGSIEDGSGNGDEGENYDEGEDGDEGENYDESEGSIGGSDPVNEEVIAVLKYFIDLLEHLINIYSEGNFVLGTNSQINGDDNVSDRIDGMLDALEDAEIINSDQANNLQNIIDDKNTDIKDLISAFHKLLYIVLDFDSNIDIDFKVGLVRNKDGDGFNIDQKEFNKKDVPMYFNLGNNKKVNVVYLEGQPETVLWIELIKDSEEQQTFEHKGTITKIEQEHPFEDHFDTFVMIDSDGYSAIVDYSNLNGSDEYKVHQKVKVMSNEKIADIHNALEVEILLDVETHRGVIKSFNDESFRMFDSDRLKSDVNYADVELNFDLAVGQKVEVLSHKYDVQATIYPPRYVALDVELMSDAKTITGIVGDIDDDDKTFVIAIDEATSREVSYSEIEEDLSFTLRAGQEVSVVYYEDEDSITALAINRESQNIFLQLAIIISGWLQAIVSWFTSR